MAENNKKEFWTTTLLAKASGVNLHTIRAYCQSGMIQAEKSGREWKISPETAIEFIDKVQSGQLPKARGFASPKHPLHGKTGPEPDPDSLRQQGAVTHIYLPARPEKAIEIRDTLSGDERLMILEYYTRLKKANESEFEEELERMAEQ